MSYELPESFYREDRRRSLDLQRLRLGSCILLLFCAWNLFGPLALIRRNRLSPEFPNSEFGIQRAYMDEEHDLIIDRRGYVDRMTQYTFTQDGHFYAQLEHELFTGVQTDSGPRLGSKYRTSGVIIDIKPDSLTLERIRYNSRRLRRETDPGRKPDTGAPVFREDGKADIRSLKELPAEGVRVPGLEIGFEETGGTEIVSVLPGHQYWPFKDTHCFDDPYLYITTDNLQWVHRIRLTPGQDEVHTAVVETSRPFGMELDTGVDCYIGHNPDAPELLLVTADGQRTDLDEKTLEVLRTQQLEGVWEREYASLFQATPRYSTDFGIPLDRTQAFRIYRVLTALLLLSLATLVLGYFPRKGESELDSDEATDGNGELADGETDEDRLSATLPG